MMFDLSGKVAVVTGGSRGIGRSICEQMAAHGAKVVVSSRKLPACEEVVKAIKDKGGEATAVAASISDKAQLENLVAEARKAYGRIDIMVCNAASNPYFGPLSGLKDEVFQKIMQNNVMSNLWLMNMVGPEMAERKDGAFIIVSSIGALVGSAHIAAYNMSKAADLSLVKSLAMEWGKHNIRVNAIAPGLIQTDFAKALWDNPQIRSAQENKAALKRIGQPDDIGGVAVFLASKAGAFVCGQCIDPEAVALLPGAGLIVPVGVAFAVGMERPDGVGEAEVEQPAQGCPRLRLAQRIVGEGPGIVDIDVGGTDVVVATQNEHLLAGEKLPRMAQQPLHPGELVGELLGPDRIAVGQVDAAHRHRTAGRLHAAFDVAGGLVVDMAGKGARRHVERMQ